MSKQEELLCSELLTVKKYFAQEELSDVEFVFPSPENRKLSIPGHRIVLCARSVVFSNAMIGASTYGMNIPIKVTIRDVAFDLFRIVLEFIYTGDIAIPVNRTGAMLAGMLEAASLYQIPSLIEYCIDEMLILEETTSQDAFRIVAAIDIVLQNTPNKWLFKFEQILQKYCKILHTIPDAEFVCLLATGAGEPCSNARLASLCSNRKSKPLILALKSDVVRLVDYFISISEPIDKIGIDAHIS